MNPKENLTPEEKLLRLIKHHGKKLPKDKVAAVPAEPGKQAQTSVSAQEIAVKRTKRKGFIFKGITSANFVLINRLIIFVAFIVLALFTYDLFMNQKNIYKPITKPNFSKDQTIVKEKKLKPFSYYKDEISKRNLFMTTVGETREAKKVAPAQKSFKDSLKDLQLLGIVSGENPQVIIEDKKLMKTYFLYTGDYIGDIKIDQIYPDRVVLEYKGEKISLFL